MKTPSSSKHFMLRLVLALVILSLLSLACAELAELASAVEEVALEVAAAEEAQSEQGAASGESQEEPVDVPSTEVSPAETALVEDAGPASQGIPAELYPTGDFDFLVVSLSWSPDYCATSGQDDAQQCAVGRRLAFVLHGLWPQYEDGWPQYCTDVPLPGGIEADYPGLFPSERLYDHEWEKHGTCSGLSPDGYFQLSALIKESIAVPPAYRAPEKPFRTTVQDLQAAFVEVNPNFEADTVAVRCSSSGRFLKELFICFEKDGEPRPCSAEILRNAARSCQQDDFLVRNIR